MQETKLFDKNGSYILIKDDVISVRKSDTGVQLKRSVRIFDGLQIEFNRSIDDYIEAIKCTRLPIMFIKVKLPIDDGHTELYQVIRMQTGEVGDAVVAELVAKNRLIKEININTKLKFDEGYRKYNSLTACSLLTIPSGINNKDLLAYVNKIVLAIYKERLNIIDNVEYNEKNVKITVDIQGQKQELMLMFNDNSYSLYKISIKES